LKFSLKLKPIIPNFKVFECKVFLLLLRSQISSKKKKKKKKKKKFENNALSGVFLGYHPISNAFKILNITNNQIVYFRSVEIFFRGYPLGNSKLFSIIVSTIPFNSSNVFKFHFLKSGGMTST